MVYELKINDYTNNNNCYNGIGDIKFWMIEIPDKCNGYLSLKYIENIFYYNSPNNFDIVYDEITNKIGFGKKWDNNNDYTYSNDYYYHYNQRNIPYSNQFHLCFERVKIDAFNLIDTSIFIQGDNNYYSKNGITKIADICSLINEQQENDVNTNNNGYGGYGGYSYSFNQDDNNSIWSKSTRSNNKQYECHMEDTNWNLKYKRSYVARKKYGNKHDNYNNYGNNNHKRRGWWRRRTRRRRRLSSYKHKFNNPLNEEFYEDYDDTYFDDYYYDINDNDDILSSCFVYELQCSLSSSICFGEASKITSFIINFPYSQCIDNENEFDERDISIPDINNAFYWSDPQYFNVKYDSLTNELGFGLSFSANNNELNLGQSKEFTLCFERNKLNAYNNMIQSTFKIQGENEYYSIDGSVYVPDICQIFITN